MFREVRQYSFTRISISVFCIIDKSKKKNCDFKFFEFDIPTSLVRRLAVAIPNALEIKVYKML